MGIPKINRSRIKYTAALFRNKTILKGLEKISEHGTSFAAGTALAMSLTVRPLAIFSTPNTEKENKQYAAANSIGSGLIKFGMVEAVALPIEYAVKNIDNNPKKFLKPDTIKKFQGSAKNLTEAQSYKLAAQILKLGGNFITAIPKSILTIGAIPIIMDKLFRIKKETASQPTTTNRNVTFTGKYTDTVTRGVAQFFNNDLVQKFAKKNAAQSSDIAKHMMAGTDILLTSSFAYLTNKSKNIKENRKKALIYNNVISTGITLAGGYGVDRALKKYTDNFVKTFSKYNKHDANLHKYIEGINIIRPAIIFAAIYYGILPIFSTFMAEKIDKFIEKH